MQTRSAPLKKTVGWTALTSISPTLCRGILVIGHVLISVVNIFLVLATRSGEGLPSPLHREFFRLTLNHHLRGGGSGQLSPRSRLVADQRVKFKFDNLNFKCGNLQVKCPKSDVGSQNLKDKC